MCATFLGSEFSSVSLNWPPESQKITMVAFVGFFTNMRFNMCFQITCPNWCKVTLVAIFSRVDFQMCPQIACLNRGKFILFAFMRSIFKCLHEQMQSFIGCIVRFLSSVGFLIISQDPWSYRCKSHRLHLYDFFQNGFPNACLNFKEMQSYIVWFFSRVCFQMFP